MSNSKKLSLIQRIPRIYLENGLSMHEETFARRVNFAQMTILQESKKNIIKSKWINSK